MATRTVDLGNVIGPQGPQGEKGDAGETGADGASAYEQAVAAGYTGTEAEFNRQLCKLPTLVSANAVSLYNAGYFEARQDVALSSGTASFLGEYKFSRVTGVLTLPTVALVVDDETGEGVGDFTVFPSGAQQVFIDEARSGNENIVLYFSTYDVSYAATGGTGNTYNPGSADIRVEISTKAISVRYQYYIAYPDADALSYGERLAYPTGFIYPTAVGVNLWFRREHV